METLAAALYLADLIALLAFDLHRRRQRGLPRPISAYGLGATAWAFRIYLIVGSIAAPILALQIWMAHSPAYAPHLGLYLILLALGRIAIALFPLHPPKIGKDRVRHLHHIATTLSFVCAFMLISEATPTMASAAEPAHAAALQVLKHMIAVFFVAVLVCGTPALRRFFGLAERAFLYAAGVWFLAATLTLPPL